MRSFTFLLLLFTGHTVTAINIREEQLRLDAATELWESQTSGEGYTFTVQTICYCSPEFTQDLTVDVDVDGDITSVMDKFEFQVEDEIANTVSTVWDMFFQIQDALDGPASTLSVTYDEELGYPKSLYVDWDEKYADEDQNIEIKSLSKVSTTS